LTSDPRFTRQVRLAEVGEAGQARLIAAEARVHAGGAAGEVEARYLRGAGLSVAGEATGAPVAAWLEELTPEARVVAAGAYAALTVVRAVLNGTPNPRVRPISP